MSSKLLGVALTWSRLALSILLIIGISTLQIFAYSDSSKMLKKGASNFYRTKNNNPDNTINGKIIDVNNEPIIGATILVKETGIGTVSDFNGLFSLEIPDEGTSTLVVSYIGFEAQEIAVGGDREITIILKEAVTQLEGVVVTALGISREKKSLGYGVGEVEGDEVQRVSQENVVNALAGKVSGVTINQASGPGSSTSIVIRGMSSLTTDNQPLFVVDGVPLFNTVNNIQENGSRNQVDYGNAISDISPEDIESMSVLKGPSAAALYGSRAANGVILITTKSGVGKKGLGLAFSTSNVFERPGKEIAYHYRFANGERNPVLDEGSAYWAGPELDVGNKTVQWNSPVDANGAPIPTELKSYPDNMKNFLQTGITSNINLAITAGNDNGNFRLSYTNMSHRGMIPNSDLFRNSISTSGNYKILDKLTLSSNINLVRTHSNDRPNTGNRGANPLQAVYTWPHVDVRDMQNFWVEGKENIEQFRPSDEGDNPYFIAHALTNAFTRDRIYGSLKLNYEFTPELSLFVRFALDKGSENRETKIPFNYSRQRNGGYFLSDLMNQEANSDFLLSYNKGLGDVDINVSFGGNYMKRKNTSNWIGSTNRKIGLTVPGVFSVANINRENLGVRNSFSEKVIYSIYGLASFGYKRMLYLDVTGRNDWSSTLPEANRSYFYPSASLSWVASESLPLPAAISLLKFRAGWAQVGNDTDPYRLEPTLGTGNYNDLTTVEVPSTLLNPNLKPEIATSLEFGMDLSLLKDRLRMDITRYTVENENQIFSISLPGSSGYNGKLINAGLIESSGWEVGLGITPIKTQDLRLDVDVNFTKNKTVLKELIEGREFIDLWQTNNGGAFTFVGEEIGNIYSSGYARVMDKNSPYYRWPVLDDNGEYIELSNDRKNRIPVGNFNPDFIMGNTLRLSYKNFSVTANFDWRKGGQFQSYTFRYGSSDWKSTVQLEDLIPGGNMSGDELANFLKSDPEKYIIPQNGHYPRVGGHTQATGGFYYDDNGNAVAGYDGGFIPGVIQTAGADTPDDFSDDQYVEHLNPTANTTHPVTNLYPWDFDQAITFDADFIKLRDLTFSYQLPDFGGLKNAVISIYTRNLMLWTKNPVGIDPERAFEANSGRQGDTQLQYRQGIERQNIMPFSNPIGFKFSFNL